MSDKIGGVVKFCEQKKERKKDSQVNVSLIVKVRLGKHTDGVWMTKQHVLHPRCEHLVVPVKLVVWAGSLLWTSMSLRFLSRLKTTNYVSCPGNIRCRPDKTKSKLLATFFDLTKAIDKVWKQGLLLKLAQKGIDKVWKEGLLLKLAQNAILNKKLPPWKTCTS
ncbi:hypothetical protein BsWGS_18369 [Bradybaena similaris]